jgi:hypothetical protein
MTLSRSFLSAFVSPTSQPTAAVARNENRIMGMPIGSIPDSFHRTTSSVEGMTHRRGRRTPVKTNLRRDMEIVERVSFILTVRCNPTLTKAPTKVPIATPTAPNLCTR